MVTEADVHDWLHGSTTVELMESNLMIAVELQRHVRNGMANGPCLAICFRADGLGQLDQMYFIRQV